MLGVGFEHPHRPAYAAGLYADFEIIHGFILQAQAVAEFQNFGLVHEGLADSDVASGLTVETTQLDYIFEGLIDHEEGVEVVILALELVGVRVFTVK